MKHLSASPSGHVLFRHRRTQADVWHANDAVHRRSSEPGTGRSGDFFSALHLPGEFTNRSSPLVKCLILKCVVCSFIDIRFRQFLSHLYFLSWPPPAMKYHARELVNSFGGGRHSFKGGTAFCICCLFKRHSRIHTRGGTAAYGVVRRTARPTGTPWDTRPSWALNEQCRGDNIYMIKRNTGQTE